MKGKAVIPLALGLGMGLLAIKFGMDTVRKAKGASSEPARKVIRAKQDIDPTVALTQEMLEVASTLDKPNATDPDYADAKELLDRVTTKGIPKGAPILKSMLAEPGTPPGVPGRIAPGYRAVSVEIDEVTGVAFNVRPGDWVDVIVVMDVEGKTSRDRETIAEVVLQRIEVASVGLGSGGAAKGSSGGKTKTARSATLLIPEEEVTKLHLAATRGKITMALRGEDDEIVSGKNFSARGSELTSHLQGDIKQDPQKQGSSDAQSSSGGFLAGLASMMKSSAAQAPAPTTGPVTATTAPVETTPAAPPWSMIVSYGATAPGARTQAMRIVYENANSNNVVSMQSGLQPGGGAALRAKQGGAQPAPSQRPQQTPTQNPQQAPSQDPQQKQTQTPPVDGDPAPDADADTPSAEDVDWEPDSDASGSDADDADDGRSHDEGSHGTPHGGGH
ncbi:MAG: Flp pilus assembly protein CpaB [Phycisphaerales bacterium]|nr:Flp pilus assembly protein CpaB [Phycisphaerales bacterium]